MTIDSAFLTFTSISLAATLLAFVIGTADFDRARLVALVLGMGKSRRKQRQAQVERLTRIADEARAARERGNRFAMPARL